MKLEEALEILYGELSNSPCISAFHHVTCSVESVVSGTLFFLINPNDVQQAIKNGAYGIVFEGDVPLSDNEIAWIKVQDMRQSMRRLARYLLSAMQHSLVLLTPLELTLAKSLQIGLPILHAKSLQDCLSEIFQYYKEYQDCGDIKPFCRIVLASLEALENLEIHTCFSVQYARQRSVRQKSIFERRDMDQDVPRQYYKRSTLVGYSLFECKIIWEGNVYRLALPYIFLPFMESLLATLAFLQERYWQSYIAECGGLYARQSKTTQIVSGVQTRPMNPRLPQYMQEAIELHRFHIDELGICTLDSHNRLNAAGRAKSLLFCADIELFACPSLQERDFGYNLEVQEHARIIFESLRKQRDSIITMAYFNHHASHLHVISCYAKGVKLRKATQKNITLPFAHVNHLTQILTKTPFHLAIIYGISKKEFEKTTTMPKYTKKQDQRTIHAITQPPNLFSVNGIHFD